MQNQNSFCKCHVSTVDFASQQQKSISSKKTLYSHFSDRAVLEFGDNLLQIFHGYYSAEANFQNHTALRIVDKDLSGWQKRSRNVRCYLHDYNSPFFLSILLQKFTLRHPFSQNSMIISFALSHPFLRLHIQY